MEVVKTFERSEFAHLAADYLKQCGIEAYLWDQNVAGLYPVFNPEFGMVRLVTHESDLERARELIDEWMAGSLPEEADPNSET